MAGIPHHMTGWVGGGGRLAGRSAATYTHGAQLGFGFGLHMGHTSCIMATIPGRSLGGGAG
jgi:hypothetical protein